MDGRHIRVPLDSDGSFALLAPVESADCAIVFVHGFWGGATTTWEDLVYFVNRLPDHPFGDADLFFFDYPAAENFVQSGVSRLRDFIERIYPHPPTDLFEV